MSESTALAVLLSMMGFVLVVTVVWYLLQAVAYWKIFTKAGEAGWKSLIPVYNIYTQYKISWNTQMFLVVLATVLVGGFLNSMDGIISIIGYILILVASVLNWIAAHKLSLAFGHGIGFTIGLILLNPIFMLILGLSGDQYQGPQ